MDGGGALGRDWRCSGPRNRGEEILVDTNPPRPAHRSQPVLVPSSAEQAECCIAFILFYLYPYFISLLHALFVQNGILYFHSWLKSENKDNS